MITEDYVTFEQAKLLKENGFPQGINVHTFAGYELGYPTNRLLEISMPTLSLVQKWLREEKNIDVIVYDYDLYRATNKYFSIIRNKNQEYIIDMIQRDLPEAKIRFPWESEIKDTYEEALSDGINEALINIEKWGNKI